MTTQETRLQETESLPPVVRTSAGLRAVLFDELDRMRGGKTNATNANAIARLVGEIVHTIEMELEVHKHMTRIPGEGPKELPKSIPLGLPRHDDKDRDKEAA